MKSMPRPARSAANPALAEEAGDLSNDFVEAGNRTQRVEGGTVSRMLPGAGGNLREDNTRHGERG